MMRLPFRSLLLGILLGSAAFGQFNWMQQSPATAPSARYLHSMAWDGQKIILFGGIINNGGSFSNQTWSWDGAQWTLLTPAHSPSQRELQTMAYDSLRGQIVLFGGIIGGVQLADTWVWNGSDWTDMTPAAITATNNPPGRFAGKTTFDPLNQVMVLYGGVATGNTPLNDEWSWDGSAWTQRTPQTAFPAGRFGPPVMTYDAIGQQLLLFGGLRVNSGGPGTLFSDTWSLKNFNFTQLSPVNSPQARVDYNNLVLDTSRQMAVLFGGESATSALSDTWLWDGANWNQQSPAATPTARFQHAMAYDPVHQQVVLFGGLTGSNAPQNDTWIYGGPPPVQVNINVPAGIQVNFNNTAYVGPQVFNIPPGTYPLALPSPQPFGGVAGERLVFDSWSDGGAQNHTITVAASPLTITLSFHIDYKLTTAVSPLGSGTITPQVTAPSQQYLPGTVVGITAAPNPGFQFSQWSGDCTGAGACSVVMSTSRSVTANFTPVTTSPVTINVPAGVQFTLNGTTYTGSQTIALPLGSATLSTASPQTTAVGTRELFQSWSDGLGQNHPISVTLSPLTITGSFQLQYQVSQNVYYIASSAAAGGVSGGGFYNAGTQATLIATAAPGYEFETWQGPCTGSIPVCTITVNNPQTVFAVFSVPFNWVRLFPSNSPSPRSAFGMVYDSNAGHTVLFGGASTSTILQDTWIWNGSNWNQVSSQVNPVAREEAMMAYDAGNRQTVLFGGTSGLFTLLSDTWVFDGVSTWTQKAPATSPPGRTFGAMAYDAFQSKMILFGGAAGAGLLADTWQWDGSAWTQLFPATTPPGRAFATMNYDAAQQRLVLFGGSGAQGQLNDTWFWDGAHSNWVLQTPAASPPGWQVSATADDTEIDHTILFGGNPHIRIPAVDTSADTWAFDGSTWVQKAPVTIPPAREEHGLVYDSGVQQVVMFGGIGTNQLLNDTWIYVPPVVSLVTQSATIVDDGIGDYVVTVTLKNQGNVPDTALFATSATLAGVATTGFSPSSFIAAIQPGMTASIAVKFPIATVLRFVALGRPAPLILQGTYNAGAIIGGPWTANLRLVVP